MKAASPVRPGRRGVAVGLGDEILVERIGGPDVVGDGEAVAGASDVVDRLARRDGHRVADGFRFGSERGGIDGRVHSGTRRGHDRLGAAVFERDRGGAGVAASADGAVERVRIGRDDAGRLRSSIGDNRRRLSVARDGLRLGAVGPELRQQALRQATDRLREVGHRANDLIGLMLETPYLVEQGREGCPVPLPLGRKTLRRRAVGRRQRQCLPQ